MTIFVNLTVSVNLTDDVNFTNFVNLDATYTSWQVRDDYLDTWNTRLGQCHGSLFSSNIVVNQMKLPVLA